MKYECPECGSMKVYQEVSVLAKLDVNTEKVYGVDKSDIDNLFCTYLYCENCGKSGEWKIFEVE